MRTYVGILTSLMLGAGLAAPLSAQTPPKDVDGPIAGWSLALLKRASPENTTLQALMREGWPTPPVPAGIPPSVLKQIATLHVGMTRSEALRLFTTEGGLSSRTWHTYIFRGVTVPERVLFVQPTGPLVLQKSADVAQFIKVDFRFLPRQAHIRWVDGVGVLVDPQELYRFNGLEEQPDDVIVGISAPYLQFAVDD